MVYWNHPYDSNNTLKVNLITYANDVLQVTGATFLLWVLENYQQMAAQVKMSMEQVSYCKYPVLIFYTKHKQVSY